MTTSNHFKSGTVNVVQNLIQQRNNTFSEVKYFDFHTKRTLLFFEQIINAILRCNGVAAAFQDALLQCARPENWPSPATPVPAARIFAGHRKKYDLFGLNDFPGAPIWRTAPASHSPP